MQIENRPGCFKIFNTLIFILVIYMQCFLKTFVSPEADSSTDPDPASFPFG